MRSGSFTDRGRRGEPVFRQAALDRYQGHDIPSVAGNEPSPMRREHAAGLSERGVQPPFPTPILRACPVAATAVATARVVPKRWTPYWHMSCGMPAIGRQVFISR
jgi:hypothetical protein